MKRLRVTVPATCANLGPGFDALAVAVDVMLTVSTAELGNRRVMTAGEGADELPDGDDNLVWRAFVAACGRAGVDVPDLSLEAHNNIPLERGMGSSAAAAVAGAVLGQAFAGLPCSDDELIDIAAELEGHADNAAAAVLGGLTVFSGAHARRLEPSGNLRPLLCVPQQRQSTHAARALLPAQVNLADAAANGARAALVVAGLSGAVAWGDAQVMTDVLHEPARLASMPESSDLITALRTSGIAACLSGAGPSVLAVVRAADEAAHKAIRAASPDGWTLLDPGWHLAGATCLSAR